MSDQNEKKERENLAIDAILASAFIQDLCDEDGDNLDQLSAALTPEDRKVLDAASKDRLAKLFAGTSTAPKGATRRAANLATSLNRADEDQELTDAARQEMERKIREAEEAGREKKQGGGEGANAGDERRD